MTALDRPVHLVSDVTVAAEGPVAARSTELASTGFYLVMVLLLAEMGMAMWFGSRRAPASRDLQPARTHTSRRPYVGPTF